MGAEVISEISIADQLQVINPREDPTNQAPITNKRLEGKVSIVTGGAGGIGEAIVRLFTIHGAKVIIADIKDTTGKALADSLPGATFMHCDVTQENEIVAAVDYAVSRHGRLDIFINNAGVLGNQHTRQKSVMYLDGDEFDWVMRVNVKGTALGMKHAARAMIGAGRGGSIVSIASVAGVLGGLGPHAYTASKHAIVGLTKNASCELGKYGVRVNCISPFGVATSMLVDGWRDEDDVEIRDSPTKEEVEKMESFVSSLANLKGPVLRAKDIAEAALYLVSDESKYVSGHNLVVDGGITTVKNCIGL